MKKKLKICSLLMKKQKQSFSAFGFGLVIIKENLAFKKPSQLVIR